MKICPVCHAKAFDDAKICFGCLHDYSSASKQTPLATTPETPPEFRITFTPTRDHSGAVTWKCAIEK